MQFVNRALNKLTAAFGDYAPWTNVYGLGRSVLAMATALTLAVNGAETIFRPGAGTGVPPVCTGARKLSAYCFVPTNRIDAARWVCVALLMLVASGWRPRVTGVIHWWVSFSLQASAVVVDGGDQVAAVLSLLLIPITLSDPRPWHWSALPKEEPSPRRLHRAMFAALGQGLLRLQVAGIYFHAAVGKLVVPEWKDGSAMYYWGTHESFGAPLWLDSFLRPLLIRGWTVAAVTWSVILLELALSVAVLMQLSYRRVLMYVAMTMHLAIIVVHGLPSFGTTMIAALLLYLHPWSSELGGLRATANALTAMMHRWYFARAEPSRRLPA